jgi:hypothetical protein
LSQPKDKDIRTHMTASAEWIRKNIAKIDKKYTKGKLFLFTKLTASEKYPKILSMSKNLY